MDFRRLYNNIAEVKKMIFVVVSTGAMALVFVASTIANCNPLNVHAIMLWTVGAYIVFSIAGLLLGVVYEKVVEEPLVESYRQEARARIEALRSGEPERLQMSVATSDLQPGMKVVNQVNSSEGALLVRPGAVLTTRLVSVLQESGIKQITVEAARGASSGGGGGGGGAPVDDGYVDL